MTFRVSNHEPHAVHRWRLCRASIKDYDAPVHEWKGETVSSEVLDKLVELITAAFGLVAALVAWNTAIQELFAAVFPEAGTSWRRSSKPMS